MGIINTTPEESGRVIELFKIVKFCVNLANNESNEIKPFRISKIY